MIISSTIAESALHVAKRRSTGTHKDVTDYIKSFWAWLVSLAGIVGLYIGSIAVHLTKYFWIVVALAAALAGAKPIWTAVKEGSKRIRTYRSLVQRVAAAETKVEQLEAERKGFPDRIREERNAGFNEAWAEIEGSLRAGEMTPPELVGVSEETGSLTLVAKYPQSTEPLLDAWFAVQGVTGITKAIVRITEINKARSLVFLAPVGATDTPFWNYLSKRATYDDSLALNVILVPYLPEVRAQGAPSRSIDEESRGGSRD